MTELSPQAKELLRHARTAFSPPEARIEAVRSALAAQIAASPVAPLSGSSASGVATRAIGAAGWGAGHAVTAAVMIGALGAGSAAAWLISDRSSRVASVHIDAPAEEQTSVAAPEEATTVLSPPEEGAIDPNTPPSLPTPTWQASPGDVAPSKSSAMSRDRAHAPVRPRTKAEMPLEASPAPAAARAIDSLAEEVAMLRSARSALDRGDATLAMRLLDAHEARFQRGTLYEERLATRVQALCALGRVDAARSTAQQLERAAPRSPHLPRVRASCIAGK